MGLQDRVCEELMILRDREASLDKGEELRTFKMRFQPDGNGSFLYWRGEDHQAAAEDLARE